MDNKGDASEVFKYIMAAFVALIVLLLGYTVIGKIRNSACNSELQKFQIEFKDLGRSLRAGTKEAMNEKLPCDSDTIYLLDTSKDINPESFNEIPLLKDAVAAKSSDNVYVLKGGSIKSSFFSGNLEISYPHFMCLTQKSGQVSFFAEGQGKTTSITRNCDQPSCTFTSSILKPSEIYPIKVEMEKMKCPECLYIVDQGKAENTVKVLKILKKTDACNKKTKIEIKLLPQPASLKKLRVYVAFPEGCTDLYSQLTEKPRGNFFNDANKMMWLFEMLDKEITLSFVIETELDEGYLQEMKIYPIAEQILVK